MTAISMAITTTHATFFHNTDFNDDEISMQKAGFILNRIYFNYGTSTKGTTPTGADLIPTFRFTT